MYINQKMGPINQFFVMLSLPDTTIFLFKLRQSRRATQNPNIYLSFSGAFSSCHITATQNGNYIFSWTKLITGREAIGSLPPWFLQEVPDQRERAAATRPFL
jgi:hypothetical protein